MQAQTATSNDSSSIRPAPVRPAFWVAAVVLTFALCAGAAEIVCRIAGVRPFRVTAREYIGWAKPDPTLGWRNNPGAHPADEGPHELMTILPDGSRDTGTPANATRRPIVIVGCSFAEGYGVRDDETFAWKLQQRFPATPIRDFGTPGYGTWQSLLLLRELIQQRGMHPAAVIYGFLPMHAERNVLTDLMLEAFRSFGGQRFSPPRVEFRKGNLVSYPPSMVSDWPLESSSALVTLLHRTELRVRLRDRARDEEEITIRLISDMQRLAESAGARFLVATLWHDGPPGPDSYRRMATAMRRVGIAEQDVSWAGSETRPEELHVGGYGHPGRAIQTWWAEKLGPWVARVADR